MSRTVRECFRAFLTEQQVPSIITLDVLSYAGKSVSGLANDMSQTCKILSRMLLDFIDDDASRQRNKLIETE